MRVTQGLLINNLLYDLRQAGERLQKTEEQLSTLKVINRPSDDPVGTVSALRLKTSISDLDQYVSNIHDARGWLDTTESAFTSLTTILTSAKNLAVQANTDALPVESRQALAQQMDALIRDAIDTANESYQGKSIFGGHLTNQRPGSYTAAGGYVTAVNLTNDTGTIMRQIGKESSLQVNYTTHQVFGPVGDTIFDDLVELRSAIEDGELATIATLQDRVERHNDRVLGVRTEIGAKINRLSSDEDRFVATKIMLSELLSDIEDTDVAEATVHLSAAENAYQATLAVGAKIIMPTLLDFLK